VLINPEIEMLGPELEGGWEGCLSVPGLRGWVERPDHIRYRGWASMAKPSSGWRAASMPGWCSMNAIIWTGGCITSRMSDLSRLIFESEIRHFQVAS
jgi:peptide deformylase